MRQSVKLLFGAAAIAGSLVMLASEPRVHAQPLQPDPSNVCLDPQQIQGTQVKDARTILFHMRDGTTWLNTLVAPCPWLVSQQSGFKQTIHSDRICANNQTITVIATGNVCRLGTFTKVN